MGKPFYAVVGTVHLPATKPEIEIEAEAVFDIEDDVQDEPEPEDKE